jgi:hypothetical protein
MDAKGGETGLTQHKSINSMLLTSQDGLGAIKMPQFGCRIASEERAAMELEDISARLRNTSVADGRQVSSFLSVFQATQDRIWRETLG